MEKTVINLGNYSHQIGRDYPYNKSVSVCSYYNNFIVLNFRRKWVDKAKKIGETGRFYYVLDSVQIVKQTKVAEEYDNISYLTTTDIYNTNKLIRETEDVRYEVVVTQDFFED